MCRIIVCSVHHASLCVFFFLLMIYTLLTMNGEMGPDDIFDIQDFNLHDIFNLGSNNQVGGAAVSVESCGDGPSNP